MERSFYDNNFDEMGRSFDDMGIKPIDVLEIIGKNWFFIKERKNSRISYTVCNKYNRIYYVLWNYKLNNFTSTNRHFEELIQTSVNELYEQIQLQIIEGIEKDAKSIENEES
jgi:hypothetical protein